MHRYKYSLSYQWYINHTRRPENAPPFELEGRTVKVPPGEVFCRMPLSDGALCKSRKHRIRHPSNLRRHVKSHRINGTPVNIVDTTVGAPDDEEYWHNVIDFIQNNSNSNHYGNTRECPSNYNAS